MDNKLKSMTRLAAIQIVAQKLVNNEDIESLKNDFDKHYHNKILDDDLYKFQYSVNFLSKLINFFKILDINIISNEINKLINFNRKFDKWDTINQAIILMAISELQNSQKNKIKIILNDYLEVSKSFVSLKDTKLINSILDKLINEKV